MDKPREYTFHKAVANDPRVSEQMKELYQLPHEKHQERIDKIEAILTILENNPSHVSIKMKLELMLDSIQEEQEDALAARAIKRGPS